MEVLPVSPVTTVQSSNSRSETLREHPDRPPERPPYTELERALEHSEHCPEKFPDGCPGPTDPIAFKAELQIFLSTFFTIFLAEIGDKTQLTVLLMSAQSHAPWVVFAGAGMALVCTSLCGVLLGKWLSARLSPKTLETSAGLMLLAIATLLIWDVLHS